MVDSFVQLEYSTRALAIFNTRVSNILKNLAQPLDCLIHIFETFDGHSAIARDIFQEFVSFLVPGVDDGNTIHRAGAHGPDFVRHRVNVV